MATTITRPAMVDDSGTPASPTGDGTTINKSFMDTVFDNINAMWSGATQVFDGVLTASGFGTHTFSAGSAGVNNVNVRNTTAGTGNFAAFRVGNDSNANRGNLTVFSSTFTTSGVNKADGTLVQANGAGGLSLQAMDASTGDIVMAARGSTKLDTWDGETHTLTGPVAGDYGLSGVLHDSVNTTAAGTPGSTVQTTLHSYSLPAGALATDGQSIRITAAYKFAQNAQGKTVGIDFGATQTFGNQFTGAGTTGGGVYLEVLVIRTGAATQKAIARTSRHAGDSFATGVGMEFTEPTETLSGAVTIAIWGQNANASANDIECEFSQVEILPGA